MRYLVNLEYDGSSYFGWSKQKNKITIQDHIENVLSKIFDEKIKIYSSGRTDKGVHALNQYFHFDSKKIFDLDILTKIFNKMINNDINIKKIEKVLDGFHSRYSSKNKTYLYIINDSNKNIFKSNYELYINEKIDINYLKEIMNQFVGEYDFLSFSTTITNNSIRKINWIKIIRNNCNIEIKINGNGFLRYMVRMIIGYSLLVYYDKRKIETINYLLKNPSKGKSGNKIPPNGLYLYDVYY